MLNCHFKAAAACCQVKLAANHSPTGEKKYFRPKASPGLIESKKKKTKYFSGVSAYSSTIILLIHR
jgi:hypothetical protein